MYNCIEIELKVQNFLELKCVLTDLMLMKRFSKWLLQSLTL